MYSTFEFSNLSFVHAFWFSGLPERAQEVLSS